jgi:hypothetical protein
MNLGDELLAVLDDPTHMWSHALKQLSRDSQRLFLALALLPKPVPVEALRTAHSAQGVIADESFLDSLRSLDDSFITIDGRPGRQSVSFRNPSLQDFANAYINNNPEWLDILLKEPKFLEQVVDVFSLAMARIEDPSPGRIRWTNVRRQEALKVGKPKYPGVKTWVDRRVGELIKRSVELLDAPTARGFSFGGAEVKIGQLLAIMNAYGMPSGIATSEKLKNAVAVTLDPGEYSAEAVVDFFNNSTYRRLLNEVTEGDAGKVVRDNLIERSEDWKFRILLTLDNILDVPQEESLGDWARDYISYAHQMADDLSSSDDDDALRIAIDELREIDDAYYEDFSEDIERLKARRSELPSPADDYEEDSDVHGTGESAGSSPGRDYTADLDRMFQSL